MEEDAYMINVKDQDDLRRRVAELEEEKREADEFYGNRIGALESALRPFAECPIDELDPLFERDIKHARAVLNLPTERG